MADWARIKTEYITTETSYRKLARKYGLNQAAIAKEAKAEDWGGKGKQQASTTQAKILEKDIAKKVDRAARLMTVSDKLLDKVEQILDDDKPITASAAKNLGDAIKSIKDTQMIRTPEDIEEQKARIDKLRKETAAEDVGRGVSIEIKGWEEEWAK